MINNLRTSGSTPISRTLQVKCRAREARIRAITFKECPGLVEHYRRSWFWNRVQGQFLHRAPGQYRTSSQCSILRKHSDRFSEINGFVFFINLANQLYFKPTLFQTNSDRTRDTLELKTAEKCDRNWHKQSGRLFLSRGCNINISLGNQKYS